ncbi:multidrug ABC transporter ATPase [Labedella phragmitis]|uniref:Multidrug ABC transporter ATPase n=1 Tax=Labedella phragmitis TaxID=2498849 RepID=A0A444PRB9_9MICO|nr:multidrug ABC transporter ATPase [Labedella phragmitis]RWZ49823.1 multidrug ABC transporter ATPase [Labedella phragmitis]
MTTPTTLRPTRFERILMFMLVGVSIMSIVCLVVVLVATWAGATDFRGSVWPVVAMTPYFGLPLAFLLLLTLLIVATVRRARAATTAASERS